MDELLNDLKTESNFAFGELYKRNFPKINHFVQKNSGRQEDAEDLFQDAMIVLLEKLRKDQFQLTASIHTYVFAICKNIWLKKIRDRDYKLSIEELTSSDFLYSINNTIENEKTYSEKLASYLLKISNHCNRLLNDIFFKKKGIEQIQSIYGYTSRHNAQNQKHKCIQQIKKIKELDKKKYFNG